MNNEGSLQLSELDLRIDGARRRLKRFEAELLRELLRNRPLSAPVDDVHSPLLARLDESRKLTERNLQRLEHDRAAALLASLDEVFSRV